MQTLVELRVAHIRVGAGNGAFRDFCTDERGAGNELYGDERRAVRSVGLEVAEETGPGPWTFGGRRGRGWATEGRRPEPRGRGRATEGMRPEPDDEEEEKREEGEEEEAGPSVVEGKSILGCVHLFLGQSVGEEVQT